MSDHESDPVVDAAPDPEASGMSLVATTRFEGVTPSSSEPMLPVIEGRPAVAPVDDSLYTPTAYDLLAAEIMNDLDAVAAKIGKLEYPHRSTAKFMRSHVNIPRLFLETAVFIARDTPELEAIGKLDYMDGLDTLQFDRAFGPVCDRLAALTKTLRHTLAARKARLAAKALQIYAILKGLARDRGGDLAAKVKNLARDLGPRGRPKQPRVKRDEL